MEPTKERSRSEQTRGNTTILGSKHIGNDTTCIGHGRRSEGTSEEAEDDQGPRVLRAGTACAEGSKSHVRKEEDDLPAKHLTERGPQQGA